MTRRKRAGVDEGAIVRHSKRPRRGRARDASADALFERALLGDESLFVGGSSRAGGVRPDRKTLQLCRQVQRALSMALAGECADDLLRDAYVDGVEPLGGPGQLLVRVATPAGASAPPPAEVMTRLATHTPRLRAAVAREICRKRVPGLSFVVVPADCGREWGPEGGRHDQ